MPDNQKPQEKKEEEKKVPSRLESIVNESSTFMNATLAGSSILAGSLLAGVGGTSVVASQPLASLMTKEKTTSTTLRNDALFGLMQLPVFDYVFKTALGTAKSNSLESFVNVLNYSIPTAPLIAGGLTLAAVPFLTALYYPIRYFLNKGSFKGLGESLKDKKHGYLASTKNTFWYFGLPTAIAVGTATIFPPFAPYLLYSAAAGNILFRVMTSEKLYFKNIYRIVTYPIAGAFSLTGRVVSDIYTAASDFGSVIRSWFTKAPKPAPAQATAQQQT